MQDAHRKGKIDVATLMNESIPTGRDEIIHSSFTPFFLFIIAHASHQPSPCATVIESDIENGSAPSSRSSTCYTTTVRSLRLSSLLVWQHTRVRTSQEPREEHPRTLRNRGHDRCAKSALKYARREDHVGSGCGRHFTLVSRQGLRARSTPEAAVLSPTDIGIRAQVFCGVVVYFYPDFPLPLVTSARVLMKLRSHDSSDEQLHFGNVTPQDSSSEPPTAFV